MVTVKLAEAPSTASASEILKVGAEAGGGGGGDTGGGGGVQPVVAAPPGTPVVD